MLIGVVSRDRVEAAGAGPVCEGIIVLHQRGSRRNEVVGAVLARPVVGGFAFGRCKLVGRILPSQGDTYPRGCASTTSALSASGTEAIPGVGREAVLDEGVSWLRVGRRGREGEQEGDEERLMKAVGSDGEREKSVPRAKTL